MIRTVGCAVNYSSVNNFYENLVFDYISTELSHRYSDSNEDFFGRNLLCTDTLTFAVYMP
jgi:hypothetical protein